MSLPTSLRAERSLAWGRPAWNLCALIVIVLLQSSNALLAQSGVDPAPAGGPARADVPTSAGVAAPAIVPSPAGAPAPASGPAGALPGQPTPSATLPAEPTPAGTAPVEPVPVEPAPSAPSSPKGVEPGMHDLSPWSMFLGADVVVKGVMGGLAFGSLLTWSILFGKSLELLVLKRHVRQALRRLSLCRTIGDAQKAFPPARRDVVTRIVREVAHEEALSSDLPAGSGASDRASARCVEVIRSESRRIRLGMGLLATIGSTSPFVGLFGTVWGIMNAFVGISKAQTTNLAVVAPGIAEALLATAIGLVAAIPAVVIYNHFARVTKNHLELVNRASGIVLRLLSRDLDRMRVVSYRAAAE